MTSQIKESKMRVLLTGPMPLVEELMEHSNIVTPDDVHTRGLIVAACVSLNNDPEPAWRDRADDSPFALVSARIREMGGGDVDVRSFLRAH